MACGLRHAWLAAALALSMAHAWAADSRTPLPVIEPARAGTQCLADPATMRREHPAMLEHQRDQTVHGGVRGSKASLKACIACHASAATGSVAKSETNFCVSCHAYTAVRIDCFGCHASKPPPTAYHPLVPNRAQAAGTAQPAAQLRAMPHAEPAARSTVSALP